MTVSFFGQNSEFGTATDDNVDVTPDTSQFDDPPSDSTNLMITSNPGDTDPRLFEIGDTYDVTWDTPSGAFSMEDATVVRSDAAPGGGGIIVLEGTDQNGDTSQVIWTPDFDLQDWWTTANGGGSPPQFFTSDTDSGYNHTYVCFAAGTVIDTPTGPTRVERLIPGTEVLTLDQGPQPVMWVGCRVAAGDGPGAPVCFAAGALGNAQALAVSPQHRLLVRGPWVELMTPHREAIVAAKHFVGLPGVTQTACARVAWVHFILPSHQIVWANGALCETLLPGQIASDRLYQDRAFHDTVAHCQIEGAYPGPVRPVLRGRIARLLAHHTVRDVGNRLGKTRSISVPRRAAVPSI